jgi:neutral ceramidase
VQALIPSACPYLAGVATTDLTPPVGTKLTGFAARTEPSSGVYLPLRGVVTALTDRATGVTLLLVNAEWLGFYDRTQEVRSLITAATGVPAAHILLCGTHTHGGPAVHRPEPGGCWEETDEVFLAAAFARLATAAVTALATREPVGMRSVTGWCGFAYSRRLPDGRGGVSWAPTLDAPHDHTVPALVCTDAGGRLKHVIFGYACHPTGGGAILRMGGDYAGFAVRELEQTLGCTAVFLLGCAGDQKPYVPDAAQTGFPAYPVETLQQLGRQLAASVAEAIRGGSGREVTGPLQVTGRELELAMRVLPRADYTAQLGAENKFFERWARRNLAYLDRGEEPPTKLPFEVQIVRFGRSLAWVAMAGEMSVEYGLRLTRELGGRFDHVWPFGYANEILGYVPVERQIPEGGYEVIGSQMFMGRAGPLESGTEEKIFAAIGEMLAK